MMFENSGDNMQAQAPAGRVRKPSRWLRKTKLCVYHLQNNCCLGSSCLFAHSLNELQDGPDLYKTQICTDFVSTGGCTDPNCTYAHGDQELQPFPTLKQKLCKWHRKGKCRNGESCSFAHGRQDLRDEAEAGDLQPKLPSPGPCYPSPQVHSGYAPAPAMQQAMPAQLASAQDASKVLNYLCLQDTVGSLAQMPYQATPVAEPMPCPSLEVVYYWRRTPLNAKVAPFVPQGHAMHTVQPTSPGIGYEEEASDDKSTSAETAGYLSD